METSVNDEAKSPSDQNFKYKAGAFMAGITGMSLLGGFGVTLTWAKRQDPEFFTKGIVKANKGAAAAEMESGGRLALRALGRGTLYSVTGFSIFCFAVWKMLGVHSMEELHVKVGGAMPAIPRHSPPQGRTEFSGLRDLMQYLIDEDSKKRDKSDGR